MKKNLPSLLKGSLLIGLLHSVLFLALAFSTNTLKAQTIYEPEGLNMPGAWTTPVAWTNPPANKALASATQVTGGRVTKIATGTTRWQTIFSVAATGGDLVGGTYPWLFTSGPATNYYQNKWSGTKVIMNTLQNFTLQAANNDSITIVNNKWYTMNWEDKGYVNTRAIFMETSAQPVEFSTVSVPATVNPNTAATITVTTAAAKCPEEIIYLLYTKDSWTTSSILLVTMTGATGTVDIPGQVAGTIVSYYAFSSTVASLTANYDLCTIKKMNNGGLNYSYTVTGGAAPSITWANLQSPATGAITTGQSLNVLGQATIPGTTGQATAAPGLKEWVGYSTTNTNPNTWTNWVQGTYHAAAGTNDEFTADLGAAIAATGTYYYATRFQYNSEAFVYGGYNGGFWNGTTNINGVLTVTAPPVPDFGWVNLQYPDTGTIAPSQPFTVYAQDYIQGATGQVTPAAGVQSWIGYSTTNTNPDTWTNWVPATYNAPAGNNDEYKANIGAQIATPGTYYFASRFQKNTGNYYYGGYSATGGGFWNGTTNTSGTLHVVAPAPTITWADLMSPPSDTILVHADFQVYSQALIPGITGQSTPAAGLVGWIGYSTTDTDPATWTNWVPASYYSASGNNDIFNANIGPQIPTAGIYYYASRFKLNSGAYVYGGYSSSGGGFWNGTTNISGKLTINNPATSFPVLFTVIDATQHNSNIKFEGTMTNWAPVAMTNNSSTWTTTIDLAPGTYEWGAINDNGTPNGLWLIAGTSNLSMSVSATGVVSGTVSYTTLIDGIADNISAAVKIYPNPTAFSLNIEMPQQGSIRMFDIYGKQIIHQECGSGKQTLDLSSYSPGTYNLEIRSGNAVKHQSIIKK